MRILIVAEHASARFGGEAALPMHYFRVLRRREHGVWLLTHARVRAELTELYPDDIGTRIHFIEDTWFHKAMWRASRFMPARLSYMTVGYASRISTQWVQRRQARCLVRAHGIDVVHQPMPVSPKEPSLLHGMGAPVVIGPMNGGMHFPPAYRNQEGRFEAAFVGVGRGLANLLNRVMPGKRRAACLLVANERTAQALPRSAARVETLVENGVDLTVWRAASAPDVLGAFDTVRLVFMGRLVDWKAVDILIDAFALARDSASMSLTVIGDGPEGPALRQRCTDDGIAAVVRSEPGKVFFEGWLSQTEAAAALVHHHVLVLPSLLECGGAVVLEAMAVGLPVIASDWGGPADYLDDTCGILIDPVSRPVFVERLSQAMVALAQDGERRGAMGQAGQRKVREVFDWERKVDRMEAVFASVRPSSRPAESNAVEGRT